ncbi:MAG TPA: DUF3341 domain-containing protein [Candidatus Binataceae bacterium]|nr:DUF3341 domain-containing protein [Candidatus Binataceae bacterium]
MSNAVVIVGSFAEEEQCAHAIEELRAANISQFRTFSPFPSHIVAHAIGKPKSRARWVSLTGGISGVLTGLAITIGTSYEWHLNAGGKPLISWPPFIVICFELMILFGGIFGFLGFLGFSGVPALEPAEGFKDRFTGDAFGLAVHCDEENRSLIEGLMRTAGAEEVTSEAA